MSKTKKTYTNFKMEISKYKINCSFISQAFFPKYKGFSLRGAFGSSFRSVCCVYPVAKNCCDCPLRDKCAYFRIFEAQNEGNKKGKDIPRGFVLEPPYDGKTIYHDGEEINFNVVLIGWVREYFPFFVLAFEKIGKRGIGLPGKRGKFKVNVVRDNQGEVVYRDGRFERKNWGESIVRVVPRSTGYMELNFVSPVRIKWNGRYVNESRFNLDVFTKAIVRRLLLLEKFYSLNLPEGLKGLSPPQIDIKTHLVWKELTRYSMRQKARMRLGGLIGWIEMQGKSIPEYFDLAVQLIEIVHIGKNTTFGLGKIEVKRG